MSKPFDWIISTTTNPALRFIRAVFRTRPHVVAAEDINREFEALTNVADESQNLLGAYGRNLHIESTVVSTLVSGNSYTMSGVISILKVFPALEAYFFDKGCRFPVAGTETFTLSALPITRGTESLYLFLVATRSLLDFTLDGELSGITTTNNSIVPGADTEVFVSYRFAVAKNEAGLSLAAGEEIITVCAGLVWTGNTSQIVSTVTSPEKLFADSSLGAGDISFENKPNYTTVLQRMFAKLRNDSTVIRDIMVTLPWGSFEPGDTISGGTTLTELLAQALEVAYPPAVVMPTASISHNVPSVAEVGSQIGASLSGGFIQNNAGALTLHQLFFGPTLIGAQTVVGLPVTVLKGDGNFLYRASYAEGAMPVDLLGFEHPESRVPASYVDSPFATVVGVHPILYGSSASPNLLGEDLYSAGTKLLLTDEQLSNISIPWDTEQAGVYLWFAIPTEKPIKTGWRSPLQPASIGAIANDSLFKLPFAKVIASAGLAANWSISYRVYITALPTKGATFIIS